MNIYEKIIDLKINNSSFVAVTVVKVTGSTPGKVGFKLIVEANGSTAGTVGGGAIEKEAIEYSLKLLGNSGESVMKEYLLSNDEKILQENETVVNMSCNGKIWLYFEVDGVMPAVYVFGAGHVGSALVNFLKPLDYHVTVIDNREEFASGIGQNGVTAIHSEYVPYAEQFTPKDDSYFVILTHGHVYDYEILKTLYARKLVKKYVGVIGSKSKTKGVISNLKKELGDDLNLDLMSMPIGLEIGGNSAAEIALSIAAQIQSVRFSKKVKV